MLHHLSFAVRDLRRAARFYDTVLGALGFVRLWSARDAIGYGPPGGGDRFALKLARAETLAPARGFHLAFAAPSRRAVDAWHEAALAQGAKDNGAPGLRLQYGPTYYAAFVTDLDGYAIEAVCRDAS